MTSRRRPRAAPAALAALLAAAVGLQAPSVPAQPEGEALSPRNASYTIEVTLDPEAKRLEGRQVLRWRNVQDVPA
ncbi:MAG TPA: hypothetical protein VF150_05640, partial [Thermoanaerobaculia bacterium]